MAEMKRLLEEAGIIGNEEEESLTLDELDLTEFTRGYSPYMIRRNPVVPE